MSTSSETLSPSDDQPRGPCAGGLLAGTLALMTAWAAAPPVEASCQRELIARKLVANLALLRAHPDVGPALRPVIGKVAEGWAALAQAPADAESEAPVLAVANRVH